MKANKIEEITWQKLRNADRALEVPFQLSIPGQDDAIVCDRVVRVIPGKRMVAFGLWGDIPVVAKIFYETKRSKHHLQRELKGYEQLVTMRVPTPRLLHHGNTTHKHTQVLIFERIIESKNLDEIWQEKTGYEELTSLMKAVVIELATQHVLGVVQHDLHLKNFLITAKQIYTLDAAAIEYFQDPLPKKLSLENLALFFAQLGVGVEELQTLLFSTYAQARGWLVKEADVKFLKEAIKRWNDQRWLRYEKKIARQCTAFGRISRPGALVMYDRDYRSPTFLKLLAHPELAFKQHEFETLKAGRSATVVRVVVDNHPLVVKRYNIKNPWHWLRRCFRSTRAAENWRLAHLLRMFGIPTVKPIAYIEQRFLGLRGRSYLIMEYINGKDVGNYFADFRHDNASHKKMAERVAVLFKNLAILNITHGDLKTANILIENNRPVLIDLDGMKEHGTKRKVKNAYKQEIARFMRNWDSLPSVKAMFEKLV